MSFGTHAHRYAARALRLAILIALLAPLVPLIHTPTATAEGTSPRGPILIDGDEDLCGGDDDGVVNCNDADGTAARPFVIEGWTIVIADSATCAVADTPVGDCTAVERCQGSDTSAALSICGISKHVEVRNVTATVLERGALAAIHVFDAANVTLTDVRAAAPRLTLSAAGAHREEAAAARTNLILRASRLYTSLAGHDELPNPTLTAVVSASDIDLTLVNTNIDASSMSKGIDIRGTTERPARLTILDSDVRNAKERGLEAVMVSAHIERSTWLNNGIPNTAIFARDPLALSALSSAFTEHMYLDVGDRPYVLRDNEFELRSGGAEIAGNGTGFIEGNRFTVATDVLGMVQLDPIALFFQDEACNSRVVYNDFAPQARVIHAFDCSLEARRNWWGNISGPDQASSLAQVEGLALIDPWLKVPVDALPTVTVDTPSPGAGAWGRLRFAGTAAAHAANPYSHVEALHPDSARNWTKALRASGSPWELTWDLDTLPLGPLEFLVRACGTEECGRAASVTIHHVEPPRAPVAVLRAEPRVALTGTPVTLSGTGSYAAPGTELVAYRFTVAGRPADWQAEPTFETSFDAPGTYLASLEVRDQIGAINQNRAEVMLRIRASAAPDGVFVDETLPVPAAAVAPALLLITAVLAVARRVRPSR